MSEAGVIQFHIEPDVWLPVADLLTMFHPSNSQTRSREELAAIKRHIADEGFTAEMIVVNPWNQKIVSGHGRTQALHELGYTGTVPVVYREYTSEADHRRALLRWNLARGHQDPEKQAQEFADLLADFDKDGLAADFGMEAAGFDALLAEWGEGEEKGEEGEEEDGEDTAGSDDEILLSRFDVPDAIWATDNDYGIPLLDINMQAQAFDQPWAVWGSVSRARVFNGTWVYYTEDRNFATIWRNPAQVVNTDCLNCFEVNYSVYSNMPEAVAIWQTYKKRWLSRWWQTQSIGIFVDLNVASVYADLNLLGVPAGWKSFCTRGYTDRIKETHSEYETACRIAGGETPLFIVYGGGESVRTEAQKMGWVWIPEFMDLKKGKYQNG